MAVAVARQKTFGDLKPWDFSALSMAAQRGGLVEKIKDVGMRQRRNSSGIYDAKTGEIVREVDPDSTESS